MAELMFQKRELSEKPKQTPNSNKELRKKQQARACWNEHIALQLLLKKAVYQHLWYTETSFQLQIVYPLCI